MPDLFGIPSTPRAKPGTGNGLLIGHLTNVMSKADLERNYRAGRYPDAHPIYLREAGLDRPCTADFERGNDE